MESEPKIYTVNGAWIDEPFVAIGNEKMITYADHQRIVEALERDCAYHALQLRKDQESIATLAGERDRQYEYNAGSIAKIAALEAQVERLSKPVSDEERCKFSTMYYDYPAYSGLDAAIGAMNEIIAARIQPAPEEDKQ